MNLERLDDLLFMVDGNLRVKARPDWDHKDKMPCSMHAFAILLAQRVEWEKINGMTLKEIRRAGSCRLAREWLELTQEQADALFFPVPLPDNRLGNCRVAAEVLRHLMATGEVDWDRAEIVTGERPPEPKKSWFSRLFSTR